MPFPTDSGFVQNEHLPLLENHSVLQPAGPFADVRRYLVKKLETE